MNTVTITVKHISLHLMQQQSQSSHLHPLTMELKLMSLVKLVSILNKSKRQHMSTTCHLILHPINQTTKQYRLKSPHKIKQSK